MKVPEGTTAVKCGYCGATGQVSEAQRRAMLETALRRVAPAQAGSFDAIERNFRSLEGASSVFGVFGKADLATIMLVVTVGVMIAVGILAVTVYRDAPAAHGTGWIVPALASGLVVVAVYNVAKLRRLLRARVELDGILADGRKPRGAPRRG